MLQTLHSIVQDVNAARGLDQALNIIVRRVADSTNVDVCSIYLVDPDSQEYVLMATKGLNPDAVGRVRLRFDEGLVGLVGERKEPLNLENAEAHPRFRYFPETGEERFHSFLGAPIIHFRRLLGVLVVQQAARRRFGEEEVAFIVTMAAQLAGAIAHGEATGGVNPVLSGTKVSRRAFKGVPGAPGIALGRVMVAYSPADLFAVPDREIEDVEREVQLFDKALQVVREEVRELADRLADTVPPDEHSLFDVYLRMLESESLVDGTIQRIRSGNWASGALRDSIAEHVSVFDEMEDPYLRERAEDIRDIGRRILMRLQVDSGDDRSVPEGTILVGEEISASQLAEIPTDRLAGVVTARGSGNSHVAILARALNIPAVMGVAELPVGRLEGKELIVDGYAGRIHIEPGREIRREYKRLLREDAALSEDLMELKGLPAETPCGYRVGLYANTGLMSDITSSLSSGCDGIGLHRTEFPFMVRERFPGEDEQTVVYRQVLEPFSPRKVVLRTLDVGGDKPLPYFPVREENPFLGWRGIRLTLDHPEIFLTQLRAMLRANNDCGNLQVLLPMISRLSEVDEACALLTRARRELEEEGIQTIEPEIGVMIEVPSAAFQIRALADRVDFFSIGTNDLTQYLLAVDRNNARVADLYDELHPAVVRVVDNVVREARTVNRPVTICGAMAGDPAAAILLLGMGVQGLSMSVSSLLRVKWVIRSFSLEQARELTNRALTMDHPADIRLMLNEALEEAGLGGLVRAGR
ncbi:phosphotransferase system enzyme I (PtsP) [Natronocella acetinitrilica]|uniref:phosphoenolpyruvate--protein phosphotransferase n=1 Tax=Natronocella acetinitrilica TaxID=414046 RepID=A0AAE3G3C4_9GAMM|nr:phosphoenolpyruvate--protein phosphotransferase [Natronocella acetinitrilica]MCP1675046.1 phosphotransferase system enzyme I (PtsP) [Natronocella acetinitrilica]